jgi:IclR family pca regulon transcriptional regulator
VVAARTLGFWMTEQQLDPALRGIAIPIKDRKGECRGSIGMTLQSQSYSQESMLEKLLPALREVAVELRPIL